MRHSICSICFTEGGLECPAEGCMGDVNDVNVNEPFTDTIRAMKLPVHCRNRKNGCLEQGEEKKVEEHEIECEFRIVNSRFCSGETILLFKEVLCIMSEKAKKRDGKWVLFAKMDEGEGYRNASKDFIEPDGRLFRTYLMIDDSYLVAYAIVIGGERVANKYRVEFRLNSNEKEFTNTHHGPVFAVDVKGRMHREDAYVIEKKRFALFNKGFDYFGDHNKDKNGETIVPIMVKIIKKELDIPKEDSGTPVDMNVEEK